MMKEIIDRRREEIMIEVINDKYVNEELKKEAESFASGKGNTGFVLKGFCGQDLSKVNMSDLSIESFRRLTFDSKTKFPENPNLMPQFVKELIEQGKCESFSEYANGVIEQGKIFDNMEKSETNEINGSGTTIAIIDRFANIPKEQFEGRTITVYRVTENGVEEVEPNDNGIFLENDNEEEDGLPSGFHGNTELSLAVGKEGGVAKNANVILFDIGDMEFQEAQEIVLNHVIKNGKKVDIISASAPTVIDDEKLGDLAELGCAFINSKIFTQNFTWGRINSDNEVVLDEFIKDLLSIDGNSKLEAYKKSIERDIMIPVTGRTSSYIDDDGNKVDKYNGSLCGNSFAICQAAGLFLLARQRNPNITYEKFIEIVRSTAKESSEKLEGDKKLMYINPEGIIQAINQSIVQKADDRQETFDTSSVTPKVMANDADTIADAEQAIRNDFEQERHENALSDSNDNSR